MNPAKDNSGATTVPPPRFRWGTRILLPVLLISAFTALFAGSILEQFAPVIEVDATPVIQRPAVLRTMPVPDNPEAEAVVQAAGWIEPDPFATHATTLTDGIVKEILFLEGDTVQEGDVLLRLIDEDARLALERAEAEFRAAEEAWTANIVATREAAVAEATVGETSAMIRQARAERDRDEALLANARAVLERTRLLREDDASTPQEFDTAQAEAQAQEARVAMAESRIAELEAKLGRAEAEKTAAQKRLELRTEERQRLELARVAHAEAALRLERIEVRAPIDGVVMERLVEVGSMMMAFSENPDMALAASLYDPERLQVGVDVPLADVAKVGRGQRAQVVIEVLPDQVFEGTVTRLTNLADIQKNTLEVKVALDDPSPLLKPDMLARVRFLAIPEAESSDTERAEPAPGLSVFAPTEAIEGGVAWVISNFDGDEGYAQQRSVTTTGANEDGWAEIDSGLVPGDLLILSPRAPLAPGQRVRVQNSGAM